MISTLNKSGTLTPAQKKEKISQHRDYHRVILEQYDVPENDFNVKLVFYNNNQKVIGVFPNEFTKQKGFFLEFVDTKLDPTDVQRTLYRLSPRDNYEDVYSLLSSGSYAVPIEELEVVVAKPIKKVKPDFNLDIQQVENIKQDEHYSKMTIKDLAAILWQSPVSDKGWLNDLIQENKATL